MEFKAQSEKDAPTVTKKKTTQGRESKRDKQGRFVSPSHRKNSEYDEPNTRQKPQNPAPPPPQQNQQTPPTAPRRPQNQSNQNPQAPNNGNQQPQPPPDLLDNLFHATHNPQAPPRSEFQYNKDDLAAEEKVGATEFLPGDTPKRVLYGIIYRAGLYVPEYNSNAITIASLKRLLDFVIEKTSNFLILKVSDVAEFIDETYSLLAPVQMTWESIQGFCYKQKRKVFPFEKCPNIEYVKAILLFVDPHDTLQFRPKTKIKPDLHRVVKNGQLYTTNFSQKEQKIEEMIAELFNKCRKTRNFAVWHSQETSNYNFQKEWDEALEECKKTPFPNKLYRDSLCKKTPMEAVESFFDKLLDSPGQIKTYIIALRRAGANIAHREESDIFDGSLDGFGSLDGSINANSTTTHVENGNQRFGEL